MDAVAKANISIRDVGKAKLEDITVKEAYRNRGIGQRLLEAVEAWAARNGISYIWGDLSRVDSD